MTNIRNVFNLYDSFRTDIRECPDSNGFAKVCTRRVLFPYSLKPLDKGIEPDIGGSLYI
jgi:hypothetical protein